MMTVDDDLRVCVFLIYVCVCKVTVTGKLGQFATQRGRWRSGWVGNDIRCHAPQQQVPWQCHLTPPRCVNDINADPPVNYRSPILCLSLFSHEWLGRGGWHAGWWRSTFGLSLIVFQLLHWFRYRWIFIATLQSLKIAFAYHHVSIAYQQS